MEPTADTWGTDAGKLTMDSSVRELVEARPYGQAQDSKGHSTLLAARFPNTILRWTTELKEAAGSDYHTNSDLIRDAVWLGLQIISLRAKECTRWHVQARIAQATSRVAQHAAIYSEVNTIVENLETLCQAGDIRTAEDDLKEYLLAFSSHPEALKYRNSLREQLLGNRVVRHLLDTLDSWERSNGY
jgi:uncharacterized membrane protein YheB (UPF0754 family)